MNRYLIIIAALALSGCNETAHVGRDIGIEQAKAMAQWEENDKKYRADMDAYLAKSALDENNQKLDEILSRLRR